MARARNILKGTFRLSIAAAVLAATYGLYEQLAAFSKMRDSNFQMLLTLECGAQLSETTLKSAVNQYGNIDLGKVGCAGRQFIASFSEIEQARTGAMKRELLAKQFDAAYAASYAFSYAFITLVLVNLAGLIVVGALGVLRWITAGYKAT